jgi:PAS domain S-box-containing protein
VQQGFVQARPRHIPGGRSLRRHLVRYQLLWMALVYILVSGAMVALALATMRAQQIESSQRALDALTRVVEEQTTRSLQTVDARLQLAANGIEHLLREGRGDEATVRAALQQYEQDLPFSRSLGVLDAQGRLLASSTGAPIGSGTAEWDHFRAPHQQPASQFFVGRPTPGPQAGQWLVPAARALRDANGSVVGVVATGLDPAYFSASWSSVDLGPNYVISLFRRDATLMMRSPLEPVELGQSFPQIAVFGAPYSGMSEGRFRKVSAMDGQDRYYAFRSLALRPDMLLVVGQSSAVVLAPWWRVAALAIVIWLLASASVAALSLYLHRARQRHADSERRAKDLGERLDIATSAAAIGAWDWDLRTDTVNASPGYYTMLGYAPTHLAVDRDFWIERCHPDDLAPASTNIQQALAGKVDHYEYDVRLRHANGGYRWTRLVGRVSEKSQENRPIRMVGVRMDIHEHRLAEDALRESEAFNAAVLDSVTAQIAVLDRHGVIVAVNEPWRRFSRDNQHAAASTVFPSHLGVNYLDICRPLASATPGDLQATQAHAGICAVMERRLPHFSLEYSCSSPQSERWFVMHCTPLGETEGGVVISHNDITERLVAEDKLRRLMRTYALRGQISRAIIDNHDPQDLLQEVCRVAIDFGGFRMAWVGTRQAGTECIRPLAHAGRENGFLASLTHPGQGGIDDAELPRQDDGVVTCTDITSDHALPTWRDAALQQGYRSSAVVAFTMDGQALGSLHLYAAQAGFFTTDEREMLRHIGKDISFALAAIASQTAREKAELALHGLLQDKEALLKEVHHRVKNNLQVVSSLLRLESARDVAPATRSVLRDMQGRIQAMALLHETLYGSGKFALVDLAVYLRQLATQAFTTFSSQAGAVRLRLALDPVEVSMNQAITCGLLVNELLSNGLKHGFPGGLEGEIAVELRARDGAGRMQLRVSDTGIGLPADFVRRQAESLGLQLASDLAGQLGGSLQVGPAPSAVFAVDFTADTAG